MPRAPLPENLVEFLKQPHAGVIATVRSDGAPYSAATWYDWEGGKVLVNMDFERLRLSHIRRDPRVAITVLDIMDWYRAVTVSLMRPRGVGGLRRVFIGHEAELEHLQTPYLILRSSGTHLVTVVGDPGVGKTRLMREFWDWLAGESPEPLRRTGRCLPYGQGITYWPLAEVLKEHFGILETDPPEVVRRRLVGREILGLTLGLDVAGDLQPLAARDRLHEAWVSLIEELVAERALVVLVEDLHWAERELLDLLERLTIFELEHRYPDEVDHRGYARRRSTRMTVA